MASLKSMNREQLNAEATRLGIADVEQLDTNADVMAAIEANETYQAEQAAAEQDAANQAQQAAPAPAPARSRPWISNDRTGKRG